MGGAGGSSDAFTSTSFVGPGPLVVTIQPESLPTMENIIQEAPELPALVAKESVTLEELAKAYSAEDGRDEAEARMGGASVDLWEEHVTRTVPKDLRWIKNAELRSDILYNFIREVARLEVVRFARVLDAYFVVKRKEVDEQSSGE